MGKRLKLTDKREWLAVKDVEDIYGISRWSLWRMMKDAEEKGAPIKTAVLDFQNRSNTTRRQPFIRVNKKSLDEYMNAHTGDVA